MRKWPDIIDYMKSDEQILRSVAQRAAGAALSSCHEVIEEAIRCGIKDVIKVEKNCLGVVSALLKDDIGCLIVDEGLLEKFHNLEGCQ